MDIPINAFESDVYHLSTKGIPASLKRINSKEVLLILMDSVILLDSEEVLNTLNTMMGWYSGSD